MATEILGLPLVVIVGPTASGKTSLAIELAEKYGGEIICADSRTVYKGMDIGTAKPTLKEQARVPHWGLDLAEPGEYFTVAEFKQYATGKIDEIRTRGRIPFLVGGSGLYVDAIIFDYEFGPQANKTLRKQLGQRSLEELHTYCKEHNITLPENRYNRRYVIRAIEQNGVTVKRMHTPISTSIIVGIATDRDELRERIRTRTEQLFDHGVVEEATMLGKKYGWDSESMTGNIYPLIRTYLAGTFSLEEIKEKFTTADWRLAKRQLTWFRRNQYIHWCSTTEAGNYIAQALAREQSL